MTKILNEAEKHKRIKNVYSSAKALGWLWLVFGSGAIIYLIYLSIFKELPWVISMGFGTVLLLSALIGAYFIRAGRKIAAYKENLQQAKQSNQKLFNVSSVLLVLSVVLLAFSGGGGGLGIILIGLLTYYAYRAKKAFDQFESPNEKN